MPSCSSETRIYNPNSPPTPGNFAQSCELPNFCPYGIWVGASFKCCQYANMVVCADSTTCVSNIANCPAVVPSRAATPIAPSSIAAPRVSSIAAPQVSSVVPPPVSRIVSSVASTPASRVASFAASGTRGAPAASGSGVIFCSSGLTCGNGWYCSVDEVQHCCPEPGQKFCSGAIECYNESKGEKCCGNTRCYAGQSCAPEGDACIGPSTASTLRSSVRTSASGAPIIPTIPVTNSPDAAALSILQTAVPDNVKSDPAGACFLNTAFSSYTTPNWYTALASPAQSYFASANAQNTGACIPNSYPNDGKLSDGAKAGIGVGSVAGVALVGVLVWSMIKIGIIGGGGAAAATTSAPAWSGVTGGEHAWNGVTGHGGPPPPPPMTQVPPVFAAGIAKRSSSSERNRTSYIPYRPPVSYRMDSNTTSPGQYSPGYGLPRRSVSPPEYPQEMYGNHHQVASEVYGSGMASPRSELSTSGAYPGHEIYSNERYEAPAGNWEDRRRGPNQELHY